MTATLRFAPSPTGHLHVGNLRTALVNWLYARALGGQFLLRVDDTDPERSRSAYEESIRADLSWLGLNWEREERQSARLERYGQAVEQLKQAGRLYPCYETAEELSLKRTVSLQQGRPPIYDRAALRLDAAQRARLEAEGRQPHWRFRLESGEIAWEDVVRGPVRFEAEKLSDPVLIRADGRPLYHLPSVVDDIDFGITHVLRGEDHVDNTALHVQLFQALGGTVPVFGHLALLTDAEGKGLSKRLGSLGIRELREEGLEAMTLASYLARLGTALPVEAHIDPAALVAGFDISSFGRAAPKFDPDELWSLNAQILHLLPFSAVAERLAGLGLTFDSPATAEAFWEAVRPNLDRLDGCRIWYNICFGPIEPLHDDPAFLAEAAALLPPEPWDQQSWGQWTGAVKAATGRKGKALFLPLRRALTGLDHGPELKYLLPLMGRERVLARLQV